MAGQRRSITKAQQATACGAELVVLCQSMTADGVLTDQEILQLHGWLTTHANVPMASIVFLRETIYRIIADRRITPEERYELHRAVEAVLPPEVRGDAVANRRMVEREEHERTRRLLGLNFMVAGVWFDGRETVIRQHVHEGDVVYLVREPANLHSHNAVQVRLQNWLMIGYVPEDYAFDAAPLLDQGNIYTAQITKVLREARVPIPIVQADIHRPDCGLPGMFIPVDVWGRTLPAPPMGPPAAIPPTHDKQVIAIRVNVPARGPTKKWWEFWK